MEFSPAPEDYILPDDPEDLVRVEVVIEGKSVVLTKQDTDIYIFAKEKHKAFNHVYHVDAEGYAHHIFADETQMQILQDQLYELGFNCFCMGTKPSENDVMAYLNYQQDLLEDELKEL